MAFKDTITFHLVWLSGYAPWAVEGTETTLAIVNYGIFFDPESATIVKKALEEKLQRVKKETTT